MKKIIFYIVITIIAIPVFTAGASFTGSLIAGKTPKEAINILAEQIGLIEFRLDVQEEKLTTQEEKITQTQATTTSIADKQTILEKTINDLAEKNKLLEEQNALLNENLKNVDTKAGILESRVADIETATTPPPIERYLTITPRQQYNPVIATSTIKTNYYGNRFSIFSFRTEAAGNAPLSITGLSFSIHGSYEPSDIISVQITSGGDRILGEEPISNGMANISIALSSSDRYYSILPGESRDYMVGVKTAEKFEGESRDFYLTLESIETNASSISGLPVSSNVVQIKTI